MAKHTIVAAQLTSPTIRYNLSMAANPKRDAMNRLAKVGPQAVARSKQTRLTSVVHETSSSPPEMPAEESGKRLLLSVGEAAARLGTDKARLRIVLSHGQVSHKLVAKRADILPAREDGQYLEADPLLHQPERGKGIRVPVEILDDLRLLLESLPQERAAVLVDMPERSALPVPLDDLTPATASQNVVEEPLQTTHMPSDDTIGVAGGTVFGSKPKEYAAAEVFLPGEVEAQRFLTTATSMPLSLAFEHILGEKNARIEDLKSEIAHLRDLLEREQHSHARTQALLSLQSPPPSNSISEPANEVPASEDSIHAVAASQPQISSVAPPAQQPIRRGLFSWLRSR